MARKETVTKVIDGDTIETSVRKKPIRIKGIDTPEKGKPGYDEAKRFLSNLILNKEIVYEQVGTSYDRIVAEVWQANINVNNVMIDSGYKK